MRKGFCLTSDETTDNFVGIRFIDGNPEVIFPHGFNIQDDPKEQRKDIFRLLSVLQRFSVRREGGKLIGKSEVVSTMPIQSYQLIICDYMSYGYYTEKEVQYSQNSKGKISWKRTIQKQHPNVSGRNLVYLNYQVSRTVINNNSLLSQIHRYCVYLSFMQFGWLYFSKEYLPEKPAIHADITRFVKVLKEALDNTFDDRKRNLFQAMIHVLKQEHEDISFRNYSIGVTHFESVWENLINYVFGEDDISRYFPHAEWYILRNGKYVVSSALEPDTIMKYQDKVYILDAKYYKYGITDDPNDLPNTSSIQKQITYAKHMESMKEYESSKIFNAFILPYNGDEGEYVLKFVAVGKAGWEDYRTVENYAYVLGVLLDTRHLITTFSKHNLIEVERMADIIETSLEDYKKIQLPN